MSGAGELFGVSLGLGLVAGDEDFVGEGDAVDFGEALDFGEGDAVVSVVTETLGSDVLFSVVVISGDAAGEGLSSWARANGVAAAKRAVMAAMVIFIWFSCDWN
jgi:hypothetical protein